MILYSTRPEDTKDEIELRNWLINQVGETDQSILVEWVWDNHRNGIAYVDALNLIVQETGKNGPQFLQNLLDFAKKPKKYREVEQELLAWFGPKSRQTVETIRKHNASPEVVDAERDKLLYALEEKLYNMFPDKHRSTMKGAIVCGFKFEGGSLKFDAASLTKALFMDDPLQITAKSSRG